MEEFEVSLSGHLSKVSNVHVLVNGGSMWTRTLREVSECIRRYHSLTLAHVVGDVPSMSYKLV